MRPVITHFVPLEQDAYRTLEHAPYLKGPFKTF
jgi:hypothetical protein